MKALIRKASQIVKTSIKIGFIVLSVYWIIDLSYNIYMKVSPRLYRPYINVGSMGEKDPYTNHSSKINDNISPEGSQEYYAYSSNDNFSHFMELQDRSILKIDDSWINSISQQTSDGERRMVYSYEVNYPYEWGRYSVPHFYKKDNKLIAVVCDSHQHMWYTFQKFPLEYSVPLIAAAPTYIFLTDLDTLKTERVFTSEKRTRVLYADTQRAVVLSKDNSQLIDMKSKQPIQTFDSNFFVSDEHYTTEVVGNTLNIYQDYQGLIATMKIDDGCELKMMK